MRTVSKRPHNFEAEKEDFLTESKRSDKLKPFQSGSLTFLDENPCYRNPEQYGEQTHCSLFKTIFRNKMYQLSKMVFIMQISQARSD